MNYFVLWLVVALIGKVTCCETDGNCTEVDSVSVDGQSICKTGYYLNSESSVCLPYITRYGEKCSEDAQCEWLGENSMCRYICTCQEGYRWYRGKCQKYSGLGGDCVENTDCFDGYSLQSLSCNDGKCVCSKDYYQRGDYDCRKIAHSPNDFCALDMDCQFENAVCNLGKCHQKSKKNLLDNEVEEEEVAKSFNQVFTEQTCVSNNDCTNIPNSECYEKTKTCICQKKYFFNNDGTECIPELGVEAQCNSDSDCPLRPSKCENGVCYCRDYYFVEDGNRNCIKTMGEYNWNCTSKEWCYALGQYSYCNSTGSCECSQLADYEEDYLFCKRNENNNTKGICAFDYECSDIENGHCIDEKCGCLSDYVFQDNKCVPNIGAPCAEEGVACPINNSECVDSICQCKSDYVPSSQDNQCLESRYNLTDPCVETVQCQIPHSECSNQICKCSENYIPYKGDCLEKKVPNSYCNNAFECTRSLGDTFQCRNRICQCPTGYMLKEHGCSLGYIRSGNIVIVALALVLKGILSMFC